MHTFVFEEVVLKEEIQGFIFLFLLFLLLLVEIDKYFNGSTIAKKIESILNGKNLYEDKHDKNEPQALSSLQQEERKKIGYSYEDSTYYRSTGKSWNSLISEDGSYAEYDIYRRLKMAEEDGAKFLFNIYLPSNGGNTTDTEIDVVMLDRSGVYIFESKDYKGWIFGNSNDKNWTQSLYKGYGKTERNRFYNPIKQNYCHMKAVEGVSKIDMEKIRSYVVFGDDATLKDVKVEQWCKTKVLNNHEITNEYYSIKNENRTILTQSEIESLYEKLKKFEKVSTITKDLHIDEIKRIKS